MTAFITLLRNNAQTFGTGTAFAWDGQIFTIFDQSLPQRPFSDNLRTRLDSDWDDFDFTFWDQGYFETSAINIYFVGNVQPAPTQPGYNETLAFTLDPMGANSAGTPSFIVVRGSQGVSGQIAKKPHGCATTLGTGWQTGESAHPVWGGSGDESAETRASPRGPGGCDNAPCPTPPT